MAAAQTRVAGRRCLGAWQRMQPACGLGSRELQTSSRREASGDDWRAKETSTSGLPEVLTPVEEASTDGLTLEHAASLTQRKQQAVHSWLEANVGKEKLELVRLLQEHRVIVRGGGEEGQQLLTALLEWKQKHD